MERLLEVFTHSKTHCVLCVLYLVGERAGAAIVAGCRKESGACLIYFELRGHFAINLQYQTI